MKFGRRWTPAAMACLIGVAASTERPLASTMRSTITAIDLARCTLVGRRSDATHWQCPGLAGYPVYYAESGQRAFVSVGPRAEGRRAARQSPAPPNSIFATARGPRRTTLEWRVRNDRGRLVPHAIILRYHTMQAGQRGELVVVMRVTPNETCHVLHVDAAETEAAMAHARRVADGPARDAPCPAEPAASGAQPRQDR